MTTAIAPKEVQVTADEWVDPTPVARLSEEERNEIETKAIARYTRLKSMATDYMKWRNLKALYAHKIEQALQHAPGKPSAFMDINAYTAYVVSLEAYRNLSFYLSDKKMEAEVALNLQERNLMGEIESGIWYRFSFRFGSYYAVGISTRNGKRELIVTPWQDDMPELNPVETDVSLDPMDDDDMDEIPY